MAEDSSKIKALIKKTQNRNGDLAALNLIKKIKLAASGKKLKIAIYDHAFNVAGGGQKYACAIADILQKNYDVTIICHSEINKDQIKNWYDIDLKNCQFLHLPIKAYEKEKFVYPVLINGKNPFIKVSEISTNFDVFINANMNPYVKPLAPLSIFIAHFPDQTRTALFEIDNYDYFISNSKYGAYWLEKNWNIKTSLLLYPGVEMQTKKIEKENIILSVARFEKGGSKKQLEMIKSYNALCKSFPDISKNWRLVLAGGSQKNNSYLNICKKEAEKSPYKIDFFVNSKIEEIKNLYQKASIFWHLCGLNESLPHLKEHFGMTTVEAMQNHCIPVVFNDGGQKEIIEDNGFLINSLSELVIKTQILISKPQIAEILRSNTHKSLRFSGKNFNSTFSNFFEKILKENNLK